MLACTAGVARVGVRAALPNQQECSRMARDAWVGWWEVVGRLWEAVGGCGELWGVVGSCGELWGVVGGWASGLSTDGQREMRTDASSGSPAAPESVSMGATALLLLAMTTCARREAGTEGCVVGAVCPTDCRAHSNTHKDTHKQHGRTDLRVPREACTRVLHRAHLRSSRRSTGRSSAAPG